MALSPDTTLMRLAAGVEYDGRGFYGWQRQSELRSVQQEVEQGLSRVADHPLRVLCAGRTDTGVHALGQVIHFDSSAERSLRSWLLGTNRFLPDDVKLSWVKPVSLDFHARFGAIGRRYRYLIYNSPTPSALWRGRSAWCALPLDIGAMNAAAQSLCGEHDFSSFRGKDCQAKSPIKNLRELWVQRRGRWVIIEAEAIGFLHNMVRNICGSLLLVGRGDRPIVWLSQVLAARQRSAAGATAPPHGLYFMAARYPAHFQLPTAPNRDFPL